MVYNKIYAQIGEERHITLDPINYQYDVKQILVISGETVPEYYEADICNVGDTATLTMIGTAADGVEIPDKFLLDGRNVLVYVVIPGSGGDVQTRYDITIPVDERAEREDIDPSEAEQQQIDSLIAALNSGVGRAEAAAEAIQDMDVEAETLAAGSAASVEKTVDPETGAVTLRFGLPKGEKGNPGNPGADGTTPNFRIGTVTTLPPESPAEATITGTKEAPVLNLGIPQGEKGEPGGDSGTSDYTQLSNKPQINGHTLDGNQSASNLGLGTYSKPASGIPKTDLADDVQQSLRKAETALQSAPVQSVAGKTGAVTLGAEDIGFNSSEEYNEGTVGAELSDLNRHLSDLEDTVSTTQIINTASGAIASFDDGADSMSIRKLVAQIEPVQDLHGQESPYPAGGGKNLVPMTTLDDIKAHNTSGTWNGADYSRDGITFTVLTDNAGNVLGFKINGTSTAGVSIHVKGTDDFTLAAGSYYYTGVSENNSGYDLNLRKAGTTTEIVQRGDAVTLTLEEDTSFTSMYIWVNSGKTLTNAYVYPMIRNSSVSDATFAPYSNICPISGWTGAEIYHSSGQRVQLQNPSDGTYNGVVVKSNPDGSVSYNGTCTANDSCDYYRGTISQIGMAVNKTYTAYLDAEIQKLEIIAVVGGSTQTLVDITSGKSTFTIPTGTTGVIIRVLLTAGVAYDTTVRLVIAGEELNQISVNWEDEAGTVYGGTVTLNEDCSADLKNDRLFVVLDGSPDEVWGSGGYGADVVWTAPETIYNKIVNPTSYYQPYDAIANYLRPIAQSADWYNYDNFFSHTSRTIFMKCSTIGALANWRSYLSENPLTILFRLKNPETHHFDNIGQLKTFLGTNNIWIDTGSISECDYQADTKLYIDNKIATAIANALNA